MSGPCPIEPAAPPRYAGRSGRVLPPFPVLSPEPPP
jgi:hypothetical protein